MSAGEVKSLLSLISKAVNSREPPVLVEELIFAASVSLAWDPNPPEQNVSLYRLYISIQPITETQPAPSSFPIDAPATNYTVNGLTLGTDYWFRLTAINQAGLESGYSNEVQYTPKPPPPLTVWPITTVPGIPDAGADAACELGVKFMSDVSTTIAGIRFYKSTANTGTHVANLWTSVGTRLASATFTNETASGWQQVLFSVPVVVTGGQTYVASYRCLNGHYADDYDFFPNATASKGSMHLINSVYSYGATSPFPTQNWRNSNYWVDVLYGP